MAQVADIISQWVRGLYNKTQNKESTETVVTAKELSIIWGSDTRYWKWISFVDTNSCVEFKDIAELIEVCWLQVDGKCESGKLVGGKRYAVDFVVKLNDNLCMNGPVKLKLTRPDGSVQKHEEDLTQRPMNEIIGLRVGEFMKKCGCQQNVKFSLNGSDGTTWKTGLVVIGAVIYEIPSC